MCIQFATASIYSASDFPVMNAEELSSTDGEDDDEETAPSVRSSEFSCVDARDGLAGGMACDGGSTRRICSGR